MSLKNARMKTMIDTELAAHTHVHFSTDGASETARIAPKPIAELGGWSTPAAANPYEPANVSAGESAACSAGADITVTHYATGDAVTLFTDWIPSTDPDPIVQAGGTLKIAAEAIKPLKTSKP